MERERGRCSLPGMRLTHSPTHRSCGASPFLLKLGLQNHLWDFRVLPSLGDLPRDILPGPRLWGQGRRGKGTFKTQPSLYISRRLQVASTPVEGGGRGGGQWWSDWHQMAEQGLSHDSPTPTNFINPISRKKGWRWCLKSLCHIPLTSWAPFPQPAV